MHPPAIFGEQVAGVDGLAWLDVVSADLESIGYAFGATDLCAASVGAPHNRARLWFVAYADEGRRAEFGLGKPWRDADRCGVPRGLADDDDDGSQGFIATRPAQGTTIRGGAARAVGDALRDRDQQHTGELPRHEIEHAERRENGDHASLATRGAWADAEWIACLDGKSRPAQPGAFPLATGVSARVGKLRAYGNSIVPQVAATFVRAALEAIA